MTDADHAGVAGMSARAFRELLPRRQVPKAMREFEAAAILPGFETPMVRMRRAH